MPIITIKFTGRDKVIKAWRSLVCRELPKAPCTAVAARQYTGPPLGWHKPGQSEFTCQLTEEQLARLNERLEEPTGEPSKPWKYCISQQTVTT